MATYQDALEWLNNNEPDMATIVLNLGSPEEANGITETAAVAIPTNAPTTDYKLFLHTPFFQTLTPSQAAAVLCHEALHILFNHLSINPSTHPEYSNEQALTIACEIDVNDPLLNENFDLPHDVITGMNTLNKNCAHMTLQEIYNELLQQPNLNQHTTQCKHDEQLPQETINQIQQSILNDLQQTQAEFDNPNNPLHEKINQTIQQNNPTQNDTIQKTSGSGHTTETLETLAKETNTNINWLKLLAEVNPDILKKPQGFDLYNAKSRTSWHTPHRKTAHLMPQVMIPNKKYIHEPDLLDKNNQKPLIILALDTSGSIPRKTIQQMTNLARKIPTDKIQVECCTFSTKHEPFNIEKNNNRIARGGTCFSPVEEFARKMSQKHNLPYPKAIVCITDLEARFNTIKPTQQQLKENWTWLTIPDTYENEKHPGGTRKKLEDYLTNPE